MQIIAKGINYDVEFAFYVKKFYLVVYSNKDKYFIEHQVPNDNRFPHFQNLAILGTNTGINVYFCENKKVICNYVSSCDIKLTTTETILDASWWVKEIYDAYYI